MALSAAGVVQELAWTLITTARGNKYTRALLRKAAILNSVPQSSYPSLSSIYTKELMPKTHRPRPPKLHPSQRQNVLDQRRKLKMATSAHAYVRGNTLKFYEWLESREAGTLPEGPAIWICGDCHVGNLGPVASAEGKVEIEIRDLDQTVIGNPAHDIIRLALSLATAARGSDLPGVSTAMMMEEMIVGYEEALLNPDEKRKPKGDATKPIQFVLKQALKRKWRHLAEERIENVKPSIPLGKCFWVLAEPEKKAISQLFENEDVKRLMTCLRHRNAKSKVNALDASYWMKGCSSLGRLRFAVLAEVADDKHDSLCLIDIKEAVKAAAPRDPDESMPRDHARRVVEGALHLSPYLGERMLAAELLGKPVVLRELLPQDLKLEMDHLTRKEIVASARFLASIVGKAHARQMDASARNAWMAELQRNRSKKLDAPSWLWASVVELVASHEKAYLEHCREYALGR
jgi:uncharacterized protein (DUF2252 family)